MANGFLQPNYPGVSDLTAYGPTASAGGGGLGDWLWNSLRRSARQTLGGLRSPRLMAPGGNRRTLPRPVKPNTGLDYGFSPSPRVLPPNPYNANPQGRPGKETRGAAYEGLPRETYGTLGSARPGEQYYGIPALQAAAPNIGRFQPGWYNQGEINRFASVMNTDQLRGLMPLIQAEQQRLATPTAAQQPDFLPWLSKQSTAQTGPLNNNAPQTVLDEMRGRYAALPATSTMGGAGQWRELARMFPGLGRQNNAFANEITPGWNPLATPEQLAARSTRDASIAAGTYTPPGQQAAPAGQQWFLNPTDPRRLGSGGFSLRPTPAPLGSPPSYRGGIPRRSAALTAFAR